MFNFFFSCVLIYFKLHEKNHLITHAKKTLIQKTHVQLKTNKQTKTLNSKIETIENYKTEYGKKVCSYC